MGKIRNTYVAGQFYSAIPQKLHSEIKMMRANAEALCNESEQIKNIINNIKTITNPLIAVILPHAGYMYSGQTAVDTVSVVKDCKFKKVMIIAPSHRIMFKGIAAVRKYTAFDTPFGYMNVDKDTLDSILAHDSSLINDIPEAHEHEHSVEVELPILKDFFPDVELLPFVCGKLDIESVKEVAKILVKYWTPETLLAISSDFTHYGLSFSYLPFVSDIPENLKKLDGEAIDKILNCDLEGLHQYHLRTGATICGILPIKILLAMTNISEQTSRTKWSASLIKYITSGAITGDYEHTVSYAGIVFAGQTGT